jgi:hypothetical protein
MTERFAHAPFVDVPFGNFTRESMRYASLYREAMISNSPNYQFLCYYKIIEGLKKRNERVLVEARRRGENIQARPQQIIPQGTQEQTEWLNSIFPMAQKWDEMSLATVFPPKSLGKKIYYIVDNELDPIRNRIAHTILRSGEPNLSITDGLDIALVNEWLPLTKCIARFLLRSAFTNTNVFTK